MLLPGGGRRRAGQARGYQPAAASHAVGAHGIYHSIRMHVCQRQVPKPGGTLWTGEPSTVLQQQQQAALDFLPRASALPKQGEGAQHLAFGYARGARDARAKSQNTCCQQQPHSMQHHAARPGMHPLQQWAPCLSIYLWLGLGAAGAVVAASAPSRPRQTHSAIHTLQRGGPKRNRYRGVPPTMPTQGQSAIAKGGCLLLGLPTAEPIAPKLGARTHARIGGPSGAQLEEAGQHPARSLAQGATAPQSGQVRPRTDGPGLVHTRTRRYS